MQQRRGFAGIECVCVPRRLEEYRAAADRTQRMFSAPYSLCASVLWLEHDLERRRFLSALFQVHHFDY